ncbi:MAG: RNA methyltransferase, partial [Anaerolineae bacterium]|nr:RNA methyltransferase [Anaerolineae bacterium]
IMQKANYRENPGPVLAVLKQKPTHTLQHINTQDIPLILGLVELRKPGNIGALLRTADAAGFRAIFLIDSTLDLYNPNIIRSSTGACFLDNVYPVTADEALHFFHTNDYTIAAAHPAGDSQLFATEFDSRTAVVMGTEDKGLSKFWIENCDKSVRIPMVGQITDSLNVSVSGAILMYEVLRQSETKEDSPTP